MDTPAKQAARSAAIGQHSAEQVIARRILAAVADVSKVRTLPRGTWGAK